MLHLIQNIGNIVRRGGVKGREIHQLRTFRITTQNFNYLDSFIF